MDDPFDNKANDYLERLMVNVSLSQTMRAERGQEPMSVRDLARKLRQEMQSGDRKPGNLCVALAAALFRLSEKGVGKR